MPLTMFYFIVYGFLLSVEGHHANVRFMDRYSNDCSSHYFFVLYLQDTPTLKRSNSDPNLAESDDMMKRKQIAMTFPVSIL